MEDTKRVAVVTSSSRPTRICPGIAAWIRRTLQSAQGSAGPIRYGSIDLAEVNLPFLDEPTIPALGQYEHEHTRAWSKLVDGYDGFFFVLPQYNWGYPAILKNALDFLYSEWNDKPVSFATDGTRGGSLAATQLQQVLAGLHMRELADHLEIAITFDDFNPDGQMKDPDTLLGPYRDQLHRIDQQMLAAL
jgi:NAD(P)H-dependent FMN reductase